MRFSPIRHVFLPPLHLYRQMPRLHFIRFKTPRFVPNYFAHVGFYLPDDDGAIPGGIYHVQKSGIISKHTKYEVRDFEQPIFATNEGATTVQLSDVLQCMQLQIDVEAVELSRACHLATLDRSFNLATRNCQHWADDVVELVINGLEVENGDEILRQTKEQMRRGVRTNAARSKRKVPGWVERITKWEPATASRWRKLLKLTEHQPI
jgi:hypothetical protein